MGQALKEFQGPYLQGDANYTYYVDEEGKEIMEGKFHYRQKRKTAVVVDGFYRNNLKHGEWVYSNSHAQLTLHYADGKLHGKYQYIDYGNPDRTVSFEMENNFIVDTVSYRFKNGITVAGRYKPGGYPDGIWMEMDERSSFLFFHKERYRNGFLVGNELLDRYKGFPLESDRSTYDFEKFIMTYDTLYNRVLVDKKFYAVDEVYNSPCLPSYFAELIFDHFASYGDRDQDKFSGGIPYQGVPYLEARYLGDAIETEGGIDMVPQQGDIFYTLVDEMPEFQAGDLEEWLCSHVRYPKDAFEARKSGKVEVQFIVETDGSLSDIAIVKGLSPSMNEEAVRVIKAMPKWKPGKLEGNLVRVSLLVKVPFYPVYIIKNRKIHDDK